jgi:hypothetical protein
MVPNFSFLDPFESDKENKELPVRPQNAYSQPEKHLPIAVLQKMF